MKIENIDLILNTIDNGVIIVNENLEVLFWNLWLEARTGILKDEIVSNKLVDFYPDVNTKVLKRKIKTAITLNSPTFYNAESNEPLLKIGQPKITEKIFDSMQESITIVPYDIEKKLVCIYVYDNTRLSEQNFKLKQLKQQLEDEYRDNERKEKKIIEQTQLAIVGDMIGNIAHQWRQPLNTISTIVSGISIKNDFGIMTDKDIQSSRNIVVDTVKYLSNTIDTFAKFVHNESNKENINVNESLKQTLDVLNGTLVNYFINVKTDLSDDLYLYASHGELAQIFLNILTNAKDKLKQIEDKYRLINIKSYKNKDNIIIEISDTAGGIDDDIKIKIFEPYFTTKHQSQGTGLGLHIVYKLIKDSMHGSIEVENINTRYKDKDLNGAMFRIMLPISENIKEL